MPSKRWIFAVAWLLLCAVCSGIAAGPGAHFTVDTWGVDEGLPQNSVFSVTQTRDGYLWFGTLNGLVRFDGVRFAVFDESNTPGLNSSRIVFLFEDSQSNLWIGTDNAGVALARTNGQVISLEVGRGSREGRLVAACEDSKGTVWLGTANGQLCSYRNGRGDVWNVGAGNLGNCRTIIAEKSGPVWVGLDLRLFAIDPNAKFGPREFPAAQDLPVGKLDLLLASLRGGYWRLADGRIQKWQTNRLERDWGPYPWTNTVLIASACEDQQGNLVVGTYGDGVYWFDAEGKFTRLADELSQRYILSLTMDREGCLWVGTDGGGLNRVKRQVFEVLENSRGSTVQSVCEDARGGIWIGYNSERVDHWSGGVLEQFTVHQPAVDLAVRTVFVDRDQRVWAGTHGAGLFQLQDGVFQPAPGSEAVNPEVSAIYQDRNGRLWLGTQGGLAYWNGQKWETKNGGLSSDIVRALADDRDGNLWIGTERGGLNRLQNGKVAAYRKSDNELPSDNISSLYVDSEGVLWIGTGRGLARWHEGRWTLYTMRDGLISNNIGYLLEDDRGDFWIGSNAGLMRVPKKALNDFAQGLTNYIPCRAYGKADGLPTRECSMGSEPGAFHARNGTLWFPTIKGLASVNPAQLVPNTNPPPVIIESVLVEGREQNTNRLRAERPQMVVIPPGRERLEIHYTSLNLASPREARFKYRLEGHETAWTEAGDIRVARYSNLPPGDYHFQVMACNEDGVWNETGSLLAVAVLPPFWRTRWFLSATVIFLLGLIIAVVHYVSTQKLQRQLERLRQQEAVEQERSRIARDIHDQLGASLTQVSLLGELVEGDKDSPGEVAAHARQISQTARDTTRVLDEIVWTVNPANDSLEGLVNYVCKYAQEYLEVAGLRYRLDVPAQLPDTAISPEVRHNMFLAAKEAVTNVVRHAQATAVRLRLKLEPAAFTLEIEDNGRGLADPDEKAVQSRNGLRNMRKRMEDIGGNFTIGPAPEGGTVVRLTAPVGNH